MSRRTTVSLSLALIAALSVPAFAKTEKEFLSDAIKGDTVELQKMALVQTPRARHSCGYVGWRGRGDRGC